MDENSILSEIMPALEKHESNSQARFENLQDNIFGIKHQEGIKMDGQHDRVDVKNIFEPGHGGMGLGGAGLGAGLGGGVLGGVLASALFGRNGSGLFGGADNGAETRLQDNVFNTSVLTKLGSIEAAIPYNEAQVQLALANTQNYLNTQATINQTATIAGLSANKDAIQTYGLATINAVNQSTKEILSAINGNEIANLQRQVSVLESRGLEDRVNGKIGNTTVDVTTQVNQQQSQQQQQAQIQGLICSVNGLVASHQNLQQGMINLGTMVGNTQTAANTRVN